MAKELIFSTSHTSSGPNETLLLLILEDLVSEVVAAAATAAAVGAVVGVCGNCGRNGNEHIAFTAVLVVARSEQSVGRNSDNFGAAGNETFTCDFSVASIDLDKNGLFVRLLMDSSRR